MPAWACGIEGCGETFETAEGAVQHQAESHPRSECRVCGRSVPAGYLAIRHAFDEHTRAEYVRAYDATSDDIRAREDLLDDIEARVDVPALVDRLGSDAEPVTTVGD